MKRAVKYRSVDEKLCSAGLDAQEQQRSSPSAPWTETPNSSQFKQTPILVYSVTSTPKHNVM